MSFKKRKGQREIASGHFFQMHEWLMRSEAWQRATVYERSLYLEIKRRYNGRNNGMIELSHREGEALLGCSNTAIEKAFKGLVAKGFIVAMIRGHFDWKIAREGKNFGRATRWRLTELPQDEPIRVLSGGTKEFMKWKPGVDFTEKTAARSERTNGPLTTDHVSEMARSQRTIPAKVSAHAGR